ncbi:hypothetical protein L3X38_018920 [Prunus dulcis]|uniref:Non-specific serine/threonine protein kinase n=1 Tax=Prunus dulcis TaxID=3755 RepID=A0AAD4WA45_PRUDU|nr:hypothetical protein L3X38_018920 [Prunus dulcis]
MQLYLFNIFFFFFFLCLSVSISTVSGLNSDRVALLSLSKHWTSVSASISSRPQGGSFRHLQTLDLSVNKFSGKIPKELASCNLLEYLDLFVNGFSGEIPESLFAILALAYVNMGINMLNGSILGNVGNLSELLQLSLYQNQFS